MNKVAAPGVRRAEGDGAERAMTWRVLDEEAGGGAHEVVELASGGEGGDPAR